MSEAKDILTIDDIKKLVNAFYEHVRKDELLGPVFNARIQDRWPEHLEKMYRFWQTILLGEPAYTGSPFPPHAQLPVDKTHFERWMRLFSSTVDSLFAGENANEAKWRAGKMAEMFQSKIEYYKSRGFKHLL